MNRDAVDPKRIGEFRRTASGTYHYVAEVYEPSGLDHLEQRYLQQVPQTKSS
jgi:hypothetical protein